MNVEKKLADAIENAINFVGVNVRSAKNPNKEFCLTDDSVEVSMVIEDYEYSVFLYAIAKMLKDGEVKLEFSDSDSAIKHFEYLKKLNVRECKWRDE